MDHVETQETDAGIRQIMEIIQSLPPEKVQAVFDYAQFLLHRSMQAMKNGVDEE